MSKIFFPTGPLMGGFMAGEHRGPQNLMGSGVHKWMFVIHSESHLNN